MQPWQLDIVYGPRLADAGAAQVIEGGPVEFERAIPPSRNLGAGHVPAPASQHRLRGWPEPPGIAGNFRLRTVEGPRILGARRRMSLPRSAAPGHPVRASRGRIRSVSGAAISDCSPTYPWAAAAGATRRCFDAQNELRGSAPLGAALSYAAACWVRNITTKGRSHGADRVASETGLT